MINGFEEYLDILKCIYMLLAIVLTCNLHFILNVVWEIVHILDIRVFKVKDKNPKQATMQ